MKKIRIVMLACLLSLTALGSVRGVPLGSPETHIKEVEQAEFAGRVESEKEVEGEKLDIVILGYRDVIFDNPAVIRYYLWQDKLYAADVAIVVGDAEERKDIFDIIMIALEEKHGTPFGSHNDKAWLSSGYIVRLVSDGHELLIRHRDNNMVGKMEAVAKEQKERREKERKEKIIEKHKDDLQKI